MKLSSWLAAPMALLLSGTLAAQAPPAVPPPVSAPPPPTIMVVPVAPQAGPSARKSVEPPRLRGAAVFVYSFLDVRKDEFGAKVLGQFHRQLIDALEANGVDPRLQLFADTFQGSLYVPPATAADGQRTVETPPVLETIAENAANERAANARYRLLLLPANFQSTGAWRYYTVRWIVMDTATDAIVWRGDYDGRHMVLWSTNENAEDRGRKLVDGGLEMLRDDQLL